MNEWENEWRVEEHSRCQMRESVLLSGTGRGHPQRPTGVPGTGSEDVDTGEEARLPSPRSHRPWGTRQGRREPETGRSARPRTPAAKPRGGVRAWAGAEAWSLQFG